MERQLVLKISKKLKHFFEIGTDSSLFEGLHISQNTELCDQYMGKYPVISISFKGIEAESYAKARSQLVWYRILSQEMSCFGRTQLIQNSSGFDL